MLEAGWWLRRGGNRSQALELAGEIRGVSRLLSDRNKETEARFQTLGRCLRQLHESARTLAGEIGASVAALRQTLDGNSVGGANGIADNALQELRGILDASDQRHGVLREIGLQLVQLDKSMRTIARSVVILRTSVTGFAVESTRTPECQVVFAAFVDELRALSVRTNTSIEQVSMHLQGTLRTHQQDERATRVGLDELRSLTETMEATARVAANATQQAMDSAADALVRVDQLVRDLANATEDAVVHMQIGDIVRQKTDHVIEALNELAASLEERQTGSKVRQTLAGVARILAVQRAQLEVISGDFETGHRQLSGAFSRISQTSNDMIEALGHCRLRNDRNKAGADLGTELRRLDDLAIRGREIEGRVRAMAAQVADVTVSLSQNVSEIRKVNTEMHLQALNAIIKTAVLGEAGATLEVLSQEVDRIHMASSRELSLIVDLLQSVGRLGQQCTSASDMAAKEGRVSLEDAMAVVLKAFADTENAIEAANLRLAEQKETLAEGVEGFAFLDEVSRLFVEQSSIIEQVRERSQALVGNDADAGSHDLSLRYTMDSERAVLARVMGGDNVETASAKAAVEPLPESSDSNIDFFDFSPGPDADSDTTASQVGPVEVEDQSEAARDEHPNDKKSHDLGDNVDLF